MEKELDTIPMEGLEAVKHEKEICELYFVQSLPVREITRQIGCSRSHVYRILRTFASEYPDIIESMKKQKEITPDDYEALKREISHLKCSLKREKLRADFYEEMVAFGKEFYGIDLKKAGTK